MVSYRAGLAKIGVQMHEPVSYRQFRWRPSRLRQAIRAMDAPSAWGQAIDIPLDEHWTQKCNGVVHDGRHWIFSSNGSTDYSFLETTSKGLYGFTDGRLFRDGPDITFLFSDDHVPGGLDHIGQLSHHDGIIYVAHFNDRGKQVIRIAVNEGDLRFIDTIELSMVRSSTDGRSGFPEFQAVNPLDGNLYTSFGGGKIEELFIHSPDGRWAEKSLRLRKPIDPGTSKNYPIQGACFSPNGHLYIASNVTVPGRPEFQTIWVFSALNGHFLGHIPVLADELFPGQELEGLCYVDASWSNGHRTQIHVVLLDTVASVAKDNIFFKGFSAREPELV